MSTAKRLDPKRARENATLRLERQKVAIDTKLKIRDQRLERDKFEASRGGWAVWAQSFTPVGVAVFAGLAGLFGTVYNGYQNNALEMKKQDANERLERQKMESALILKTAEVSDPKVRARNMVFFVETGFLTLKKEGYLDNLRKLAELSPGIPAGPPSLPPTGSQPSLEPNARSAYQNVVPQINSLHGGSITGRKVLDVAIAELKHGAWEGDSKGEESIRKYWRAFYPSFNSSDASRLPWSGVFVSYCLALGTDGTVFKPAAAGYDIEKQFEAMRWLHRGGPAYEPQPGDVFFIPRGNTTNTTQMRPLHSGIVLSYDPKLQAFTAISGNISNILGTSVLKNDAKVTFGHIP